MLRVLVADDSPSVCRLLAAHLHAAGDLAVIATAGTGERAVELVAELRPDVVTMDLDMPGGGGLAAVERIMADAPTPVVLLTGAGRRAAQSAVSALAAGAVDFVPKYTPGRDTDPDALRDTLISKVRLAAGVKVIRTLTGRPRPRPVPPQPPITGDGVLLIGASTGGPPAVTELLRGLGDGFPLGVVVIQHLPAAFTAAFADHLARETPFAAREAADCDAVRPGLVLVAPGDQHLTLTADTRVSLDAGPKVGGHRPSVNVAFASAAKLGRRAAAVLLTGMGEDGATGLRAIREAGGRTFAQDAGSSAVYGMPKRAAELDAAAVIDTPAGIAARLIGTGRTREERSWSPV